MESEKRMGVLNVVFKEANVLAKGRFNKSRESINKIVSELNVTNELNSYQDYFKQVGRFMLDMMDHSEAILKEGFFENKDFDTLLKINHDLFRDILYPQYETSYVNPTYACEVFGKEMGHLLSSFNYLVREFVGYAYEQRQFDMMIKNEMYLELYTSIVLDKEEDQKVLRCILRDKMIDSIDQQVEHDWIRQMLPEFDTYSHIVDGYDLTDLRYLFRYGMFIGSNEIKVASYILGLKEEKKQLMADTFSEAFIRGYVKDKKPLEHKKNILVTYHLGFEDVIKKVYKNFEVYGLKPLVFYHLRGIIRPRLYNTRANKQMEYDHRFSDAVYIDEHYHMEKLEAVKRIFEKYKKEENEYAGPALMEIFGEEDFEPKNYKSNMSYNETLTSMVSKHTNDVRAVQGEYLPRSSYSFTINAYPLPTIGKDFEAIFDDIISVNTLDQKVYEGIQQKIIDALDQSDYAVIKGEGDNETDLKVHLQPLNNPLKETKFDNCTADVNVPVGEVFTSPQLKGTEGLLHVKEVYLVGLRYVDLKIWFEDGMVVKYDCGNFEDEAENKAFIKETLLHPHDTLPMGEFAIGTNTVAYMMAKKYGIQAKLPILIGEKTGPHFAIGDTCFVWSEDRAIYNYDGKEMIARENEKTCKRKEDVKLAYTYRHTDITIPYNELDTIIGYNSIGESFSIIEGGRFVLKGTELLNKPFDE